MPEQPEITDSEELMAMFRLASKEKFWGKLTFGFQNGVVVLIRKEKTTKAKISFD